MSDKKSNELLRELASVTMGDGASTITRNASGQITQIDKVVTDPQTGPATYRKTLTYTDGKLTGISAWTLVA